MLKFDRQPQPEAELPKALDIAQVCIYALSILSISIFIFLPFFNLLNPSPWQQAIGTLHGFGSMLTTVVVVYTGHMAFPLIRGSSKILPQVRTASFWTVALTTIGILSGDIAFMRFSAPIEHGGAKEWLKVYSPLVPNVLSCYHRYSTLFLIPLSIATAWTLWRYGDSILDKKNQAVLAATCIALMGIMFFAMGGMVTGLAISKVRAL